MIGLIKKYWDILGGFITGIILSWFAGFKLEKIQLAYSMIILILVSIGVFKIIRQTIEGRQSKKHYEAREKTPIDLVVDGQQPLKAIRLASEPTRDGETLGRLFLEIWGGFKKVMKNLKTFFDKFKGFMLAAALVVLSVVEACGGVVNELFQGKLVIHGVEVLPILTLICAVIVGCVSNSFTKEQLLTIQQLFAKTTDSKTKNELVINEIKRTLKEAKANLAQANKTLDTQNSELKALESGLEQANNTLDAKRQMFEMTPRLATEADVNEAALAVSSAQADVSNKKAEICNTESKISQLSTTIEALQSQL